MIIALLILIVFILLFGAGMVKGWLANTGVMIVGFVVLAGLILWVGSFFGEDGPTYVVFGGMGLLLALAIWVKASDPIVPDATVITPKIKVVKRFHSHAPSREEKKAIRRRIRGL